MGTGNKGLYITGGVCLVAGMALKQLGSVKGARKRLGTIKNMAVEIWTVYDHPDDYPNCFVAKYL